MKAIVPEEFDARIVRLGTRLLVLGSPDAMGPEGSTRHNCDEMGCGSNHVLAVVDVLHPYLPHFDPKERSSSLEVEQFRPLRDLKNHPLVKEVRTNQEAGLDVRRKVVVELHDGRVLEQEAPSLSSAALMITAKNPELRSLNSRGAYAVNGPNGDPDTIDTPINVRVSIVGDLVLVTFQTKRDLAAGTLYAIPIRGTRQGRDVVLHNQDQVAAQVTPQGVSRRIGDTDTTPEASSPEEETLLREMRAVNRRVIEAERATFSDGTVATPQDLPFPPKLVLPTRMLKESKATCMKCGEGVNPNQHEFRRSFAGTCTECGEGMLSPHHILHTCPPGTPDFPPEPM